MFFSFSSMFLSFFDFLPLSSLKSRLPFDEHQTFFALIKSKQASLCSFGLSKTFHFMGPFFRHAKVETSFTLFIWLAKNVSKTADKNSAQNVCF